SRASRPRSTPAGSGSETMKLSDIEAGAVYQGGSKSRFQRLHGQLREVLAVETCQESPRLGKLPIRTPGCTTLCTSYLRPFARWPDRRLPTGITTNAKEQR